MNKVPFKMIELTLSSGEKINLEDLLNSMYDRQMYSISGANYTKSTVEDVISYLKSKGGGTVVIPPTGTTNKLKIDVHKNKTGDLTVRYLYNGYRPPNSGELRPFTGDEWQAGDIMFNMDMVHSDDTCYLWYCKSSGNPGSWVQQSVWAFNADDMAKYADASIKKTLTSDVSTEVSSQLGTKLPSLVQEATEQASAAKSSQEAAKTSETNAHTSETNSEISHQKAKKWAEATDSPDGAVDTESPTGKTQSAKIWAALSKEYAGLSKFKLPIGYYNSVDEMRKSETAIVGRPCVTLGYYAPNDGGGAVYIIRQKKESDVDDGGSTIVLDNENVAELLIDGDINVKQFGAHGNGADNDTDAFTKAISFASSGGHNILIPHGKYNITTIEIPANVSLYGFGASIYSESELTFDIKSTYSANRSFIDNINFYAKNPITIETGRKVTINECSFYNVTGTGINVKKGYEHDIRNCDFYGSGTDCIAINMATSDSRIDNCIMIDCYVGIKVGDNNCYISNVHAWIESPILLRGSLMFDFGEGHLFINQCCCDTYHYVFRKKGYNRVVFNELYVINNSGIWTQGMNADEKNILTSTSNLDYLVSVKMIGCNILSKIKTNDDSNTLPIFIDDTSYAPSINNYISDITYDTTLATAITTSTIIIKGNVMVINIACELLKNTTGLHNIGSFAYPSDFNNTITFTGVVCTKEDSSNESTPVDIAYIRIVKNKIYVSTSKDYTGKVLLASTTIYTSKQ